MNLRTPRRRISPRTKLKYRAIREFFRRAIGSASQKDIKINSSISVNVADLKRKIVGLEQQLDEVSKHCRDIACLDNYSRRSSEGLFQSELKHDISNFKQLTKASSKIKSNGIETQLICKSSECIFNKSEDSVYSLKNRNGKCVSENQIMVNKYNEHNTKQKNKNSKNDHRISNNDSNFHKHKARSVSDNIATTYSTSSFHSLANARTNHLNTDYPRPSNKRNQLKEEFIQEIFPKHRKSKVHKDNMKKNMCNHIIGPRKEKRKRLTAELDQDFIADIIRKQYKPVKMIGPKESDLSQFSAPVCRDQEFTMQENFLDDSEFCSCLYAGTPHKRSQHRRKELHKMPSVCDARLYNSKKHFGHKNRRTHVDDYSNSDIYDLVPVKEKSSPKSRRKLYEDSIIPCNHYREVPPSPRTLRPRLNLKAQDYTDPHKDYKTHNKDQLRRRSPSGHKCYLESMKPLESDISEIIPNKNVVKLSKERKHMQTVVEEKQTQNQSLQDMTTMNGSQCPQYVNEQTSITIDTSLNKSQETEINFDRTDKDLCEIKDILQTFLREIKKENIASQCYKPDITSKSQHDSNVLHDSTNTKLNSNMIPNSTSFNNYNVRHWGIPSPCIPPFNNPCCYPIVPLCPLNCPVTVPGGYLIANQSFTCTNCGSVPKETNSTHCCNKNNDAACRTETQELIKEIYKFVAQGPVRKHDSDSSSDKRQEDIRENAKILTSRSVGDNCGNFQHDANVGTQPLKCHSRSCEAIKSRMDLDPYYNQNNPSYSDSLLEKVSLEVTQSTSDTEIDTIKTHSPYKAKGSKFSRFFRSFRLFKKKKKDVIEELSENDSVIDVDVNPKQSPPFQKEISNYTMHRQDYYYPPPIKSLYPKPHDYHLESQDYQSGSYDYHPRLHEYKSRSQQHQPQSHEYQPDYHGPHNPHVRGFPSPYSENPFMQRCQPRTWEHTSPVIQPPTQRSTAPPFNSSYENSFSGMQPLLYLKEIEVKSTGTQSERRMSFFSKIKRRMKQPMTTLPLATDNQHQRSFSTQTQEISHKPTINMTKPLFNWKKIQSKAMQELQQNDPITYSLKTQKDLADGGIKLRNAMLKKLFHKRKPFSPRHQIMKTLLGKDKASFGNPATVFQPRTFL